MKSLWLLIALGACTGGDDGGDGADADGTTDETTDQTDGGFGAEMTAGPSLAAAPENTMACRDGFPVQQNPTFPQPFIMTGAPSCTLIAFAPGSALPGDGRVVSATLRTGPVTGPMRFVRMRILYQNGPGAACCSEEELGEEFTPPPNSMITVPLGWDMVEDHVPPANDPTIVANDLVGLEMLTGDVPIPGYWTRNGGSDLALPDYWYAPALSTRGAVPSQNLRSEGSFSAFQPAFTITYQLAQ